MQIEQIVDSDAIEVQVDKHVLAIYVFQDESGTGFVFGFKEYWNFHEFNEPFLVIWPLGGIPTIE